MAGVSILLSYTAISLINNKRVLILYCTMIISIYGYLTYERNKVWQSGIALWSDVILKSPNKARPYHNRGFHYLEKGEYVKAIADFNRTIELSPQYLQAYTNRATAHRALGQPLKALDDYSKALELRSNNAQAYHNRAHLYASMGHLDKAFADYASSIKANPNYFLAYYNRGRVYLLVKRYKEALTDLNRSIELYPDFPYHYSERGKVYLYLRQNEEAKKDFSTCLKHNINGINCLNNRAIINTRLKSYDLAQKDLKKVIELQPENGAAFFNRSLIFLIQKNIPQALNNALRAQELGYPVGETYLDQLRSLKNLIVPQ